MLILDPKKVAIARRGTRYVTETALKPCPKGCMWWSHVLRGAVRTVAAIAYACAGPAPKAWQSFQRIKNGPTYDSVSDSTVIRLSPSSPNVLLLLLPGCLLDSAAVAG